MARMSPEVAKTFLGVQKDGKLSRCPDMPNCTCSQYPDDRKHFQEALVFKGEIASAKKHIEAVVKEMKGAKIVSEKGPYLHATFTSGLFKFVDDVEFLIKPDEGLVHFRSASRLGKWDLGANRRRMEELRSKFQQRVGP